MTTSATSSINTAIVLRAPTPGRRRMSDLTDDTKEPAKEMDMTNDDSANAKEATVPRPETMPTRGTTIQADDAWIEKQYKQTEIRSGCAVKSSETNQFTYPVLPVRWPHTYDHMSGSGLLISQCGWSTIDCEWSLLCNRCMEWNHERASTSYR